MMDRLIERAERIARAAQARRLQQIAAQLGASGMRAQIDGESVVFQARGLAQRWVSDPLVRFVSARTA